MHHRVNEFPNTKLEKSFIKLRAKLAEIGSDHTPQWAEDPQGAIGLFLRGGTFPRSGVRRGVWGSQE